MHLRAYRSDGILLFHMHYVNGDTKFIYVKDSIANDTNRWLNGLHEWVEEEAGFEEDGSIFMHNMPRTTPTTSPLFIFRLRDYLKRQFNNFRFDISHE